eukprot:6481617-Amphidinium_carterae.2
MTAIIPHSAKCKQSVTAVSLQRAQQFLLGRHRHWSSRLTHRASAPAELQQGTCMEDYRAAARREPRPKNYISSGHKSGRALTQRLHTSRAKGRQRPKTSH